jgi:hypothetical protein
MSVALASFGKLLCVGLVCLRSEQLCLLPVARDAIALEVRKVGGKWGTATAVPDNPRLDDSDTGPWAEPTNGLHAGALAATKMGSTAGRDLA